MALRPPRKSRIYEQIRARGIRQSEVSRLSNIPQSRLSRLCRGQRLPSAQELAAIGQVLGVAQDALSDPLASLDEIDALVEGLCEIIRSDEGKLMVQRCAQRLAQR